MAYIIFNNIDSRDKGLKITYMDLIPRAEQIKETTIVPGRLEPIVEKRNNYKNVNIKVEFEIPKSGVTDIHDIWGWLSGSGTFITSDEPGLYRNATSCSPISLSRENGSYRKITVNFELSPLAYSIENDPVEITVSDYTLEVDGNKYCQPIYKVYGDGNVIFRVNGEPLRLYNVEEFAIVDTTLMICHKNGTNVLSNGKLPFLAPGNNRIQFGTNTTKIEIIKNERWE